MFHSRKFIVNLAIGRHICRCWFNQRKIKFVVGKYIFVKSSKMSFVLWPTRGAGQRTKDCECGHWLVYYLLITLGYVCKHSLQILPCPMNRVVFVNSFPRHGTETIAALNLSKSFNEHSVITVVYSFIWT